MEQNGDKMAWWYKEPALKFWEGLPIGTGRYAAMVHGTVPHELITFNDETLWSGTPYNPNNPEGPKILDKVRRLAMNRNYHEADRGIMKMVSRPMYTQCYQAMGVLHLAFEGHENAGEYRRELDIEKAIASVSYELEGVTYRRELFASYPDQVIVIRLTASKPGKIKFLTWLDSLHRNVKIETEQEDTLFLSGKVDDKPATEGNVPYEPFIKSEMKWQAGLRLIAVGGSSQKAELSIGDAMLTGIRVEDADEAVIILAGATNYVSWNDISGDERARCHKYLEASNKTYEALLQRHLEDYIPRFERCSIDLGSNDQNQKDTAARISDLRNGMEDPQFTALYFQYARYLLLAAAREGTLAFNNHNIWLDNLEGRWQGRWTLNINLQECYWPVENTNLPEVNDSLYLFVKQLSEAGERTARELYGFHGWCVHHGVDIWMNTSFTSNNAYYGFFPTAGAWLCFQLYEHYRYNPERSYLEKIYPLMRGAAEFCMDLLITDTVTGMLVSCPSTSPENRFINPADGEPAGTTLGSAVDMQIIRSLLRNCMEAGEVLDVDQELRRKMEDILKRLAGHSVGKHGQLQEWLYDFDEFEVEHRHLSHLFAAYPDDDITPNKTPCLAKAVRTVLERRGETNLGWAGAWKTNLWARLGEPEKAYEYIKRMLTDISIHPREEDSLVTPSFEGNQGIQAVSAGIAEMLLQSHEGEIKLLPALPHAWKRGCIKGFRARGGFLVNLSWENGCLASAEIKSRVGGKCRLRTNIPINVLSRDLELDVKVAGNYVTEFFSESGGAYRIVPAGTM